MPNMPKLEKKLGPPYGKNTNVYFLYAYTPLKHASAYCDENWGYALIDHRGILLKIFSTAAFKERCARREITEGINFLDAKWEGTAVSKAFGHGTNFLTRGEENTPLYAESIGCFFADNNECVKNTACSLLSALLFLRQR